MSDKKIDETIKLKENSLLKHRPDLFENWNFKKNSNLGLNIYDITIKSNKKVWWICEKGHDYQRIVSNHTVQKSKCPTCSNSKQGEKTILIGVNDMWTTSPEQASHLAKPNDGYRYTQSSRQRVDWLCPKCHSSINLSINNVYNYGIACPLCSNTTSFGEKIIYSLLKMYNIDFIHDKSMEWSNRKRYDFYLPEYNWIIEVHGIQHYDSKGFSNFSKRVRTLEEESDNDQFKKDIAIKNGIDNYIVLDSRVSKLEHIKKSIENSDLKRIVT